ncbi:hypothetical protein AND_006312 [Anopheles darlingi]|uniref:Uncharacterized protein n=1 Tax=Anopheles darlingi TaxID=43151 RepID=W5JGG8_ANODA|nr:hypothetical protein AND_006312 [Anopheles darlingi]
MATREQQRREEYSSSSNVVRVLSPSRPLSPSSHSHPFDNNLDNLLEDLQASVSRPGSSLGQPIGNNYTTTTREVQYLQPANATTIARERSVSPSHTTNERKIYKTAKYEYKSSGGGTSGGPGRTDQSVSEVYQRNINQLDTLLNDLERERDSSLDRSNRNLNRDGIDSGLLEPGTKVIKTTTTYSSTGGRQTPVNRELVFDSPNSYEVRQSRSRHRSPSYENQSTTTTSLKNVSYSSEAQGTGIYGGINRSATPQRSMTPARSDEYYTETRTISPSSTTTVEVVPRNVRYNETVHVDNAANVLSSIPLSDDILPRPNTKVTTTVRTYTYELPPDSAGPLNQTISYTNQAVNQTTNTLPASGYPAPHVNPATKTVMLKNESFNTSSNVQEYPVQSILNHPLPPNTAKTVYYKKDTKHSTTNYYPDQPPLGDGGYPPNNFRAIEAPPPTTGNAGSPVPVKYTVTDPSYPPGNNATYIYREERTNTSNNRYGSPVPISAGEHPNAYPHGPHHGVPPPTTVTYKYSSTTTNATRNLYPPPAEREPLLQPFPTDGTDRSDIDGNPPKRLDDLMATFGEDGQITYQSKVINTSQTDGNGVGPQRGPVLNGTGPKAIEEPADQKAAQSQLASKNIAGPPVYYPPGHEMFAKKEMEASGWRSQGEYAKASGMYKYEAESKSKSSSKSGAAVVPVCLPLCCAMPCTIM